MNGIVDMWKSSLSSLENFTSNKSNYSYFIKKKSNNNDNNDNDNNENNENNDDQDDEDEEEGLEGNNQFKILLQNTISWSYVLMTIISIHEKQYNEQKKKEILEQSQNTVSCGYCNLEGYFQEKKSKLKSLNNQNNQNNRINMMRCSKCKMTYYCSKEHQQSHWNIHKVRIFMYFFIFV